MPERINRVAEDEKVLKAFYKIEYSAARIMALRKYYEGELQQLYEVPFDDYDQESKVDYLLLKNYLRRNLKRVDLDESRKENMAPLMPYAPAIIDLCMARQAVNMSQLEAERVAQTMHDATKCVTETMAKISKLEIKTDKITAYRAANMLESLRGHLSELAGFFGGYNPLFDWWVSAPYARLDAALKDVIPVIQAKLAGMKPNDKDEIIGDPIGRDSLLAELEAEMIPYTPEQLLEIAKRKYAWCVREMKRAARELGFGDDWKAALDHVQRLYGRPEDQLQVVKDLVDEGVHYVKKHDLVTVPPLSEHWRMFMMSPEAQKTNPFFLGGTSIIVSYPTAGMAHEDKLMSMRGNNKHLSRATAFHEMIPGHHLQGFMAARHRPYRRLFTTPFYVEGWAMYWELTLWARGDFFVIPEDRIGTLFWRMHRCARILFSLRFHLGELTAPECVDLLVDMVGHERNTAEGEVRRSLNGDYSPLYQAGYFLGAMQLDALRGEVLGRGLCGEKAFHDRILREGEMPIEMMRALFLEEELTLDRKATWKFQGDVSPATAAAGLPMRFR